MHAEKVAFHTQHKDFSIENFFKNFHTVHPRFAYSNESNSTVLLKNKAQILTNSFNSLIIITNKLEIFLIKNNFKQYLNYRTTKGNLCRSCGDIVDNIISHKRKDCHVSGMEVSVGEKVAYDEANVRQILNRLDIEENTDSDEPPIFLKRAVKYESSSVVTIMNEKQAREAIFILYYYNSFLDTPGVKRENMNSLRSSRKFKEEVAKFTEKYQSITIQNLEQHFKIKIKFYLKSYISNRLLPCKFDNSIDRKKIFVGIIAENTITTPRSHTLKFLSVRGVKPGFCGICGKYYGSVYHHSTKCLKQCVRCLQTCDNVIEVIEQEENEEVENDAQEKKVYASCIECRMDFSSEQCYKLHLHKTCGKISRCCLCRAYLNRFQDRSKHVCTEKKCGTCKEKISKSNFWHQCRIPKRKIKTKPRNIIRIWYDMETYLNLDQMGIFQP